MSKFKLKIVFGLVLIFAAGALSGGSLAWKKAASRRSFPPPERNRPTPAEMSEYILHDWKQKFDLSDDQLTRIRPLLQSGIDQVRQIQVRSVQEVREAMKKSDERITRELSPEQKTKFEEMQRERDKHRLRIGPGHHGPGDPRAHGPRPGTQEAPNAGQTDSPPPAP
jgi:Spy/CpxP family protein refolding chaperone